jgi:hypothetical protein
MIAVGAIGWALFAFGCYVIAVVMLLAFLRGASESRAGAGDTRESVLDDVPQATSGHSSTAPDPRATS